MERVTVAELRGQMKAIFDKVEQGQAFEITKRDKVIAHLGPPITGRPAQQSLARSTDAWHQRNPQQAGRDALLARIRGK